MRTTVPYFEFEAMDATGLEICESIEAEHEAEAQQLVRQRGYFLTKIRKLEGPSERAAETAKWLKSQKPDCDWENGKASSPKLSCWSGF
jgi:type IV pilus assembly protein PilC